MITLRSEHLEIQIQEPGSKYKRSRFDWNGICEQITLDGCHTFLSQEASENELGTEGIGLSDEFSLNTPIGYVEIAIGEWFPKIGVGFLQKVSSRPYDFFADYALRTAPIQVEKPGDQTVTFRQVSENLNGWGWNLRKTFSLVQATVTISYVLENTGEKVIQTDTYNHNFLVIDGKTVGPDYRLQTPFALQPDQVLGPVMVENDTLSLSEIPQKYFYASQTECTPQKGQPWNLIHQPGGHGVRVVEDFPLYKFAIWGMRHVISPEFFLWINLKPGETQTWKRQYTFF